jgi:hypothetical protein
LQSTVVESVEPPAWIASLYLTAAWGIPWLLGRIYYSSREGANELTVVIVAGPIVITPVALLETFVGPIVYGWLYEPHPFRFDGMIRYGGFRPLAGLATSWALTRSLFRWVLPLAFALIVISVGVYLTAAGPLWTRAETTGVGRKVVDVVRATGRGSILWRFARDQQAVALIRKHPIVGNGPLGLVAAQSSASLEPVLSDRGPVWAGGTVSGVLDLADPGFARFAQSLAIAVIATRSGNSALNRGHHGRRRCAV